MIEILMIFKYHISYLNSEDNLIEVDIVASNEEHAINTLMINNKKVVKEVTSIHRVNLDSELAIQVR